MVNKLLSLVFLCVISFSNTAYCLSLNQSVRLNASSDSPTYEGSVQSSYSQNSNDFPYELKYSITYNANKTLTVNASLIWGEAGAPAGAIDQMYVDGIGNEKSMNRINGSFTSTETFESGVNLSLVFRIPAENGGMVRTEVEYEVGDSNSDGQPDPNEPGETDPDQREEPVDGIVYEDFYEGTYSQSFDDTTTDYNYVLDYKITYTSDKFLNIETVWTWEDGKVPVGGVDFMYLDINDAETQGRIGGEYALDQQNNWTCTTTTTFEPGQELILSFRKPANGPTINPTIPYTVGSVNAPRLKFSAIVEEVTTSSAQIKYELLLPADWDDAKVTVKYNKTDEETEGTIAESHIITLSGLEENTAYSYTLTASAEKDGEEPLSATTVVTFTTLRDMSVATHYYQITNGFLENAYYEGEDDKTDRRNLPITYKSDITYNPDGTVSITYMPQTIRPIVGLEHEINIGDEWSGNLAEQDGSYTYTTTKKFEDGSSIVCYYWTKYNSGVARNELTVFTLGESNEPVEYGAPTEIILSSIANEIDGGRRVPVDVYMRDAAGNFIFEPQPELKLTEGNEIANLEDGYITLNLRGSATVTASYGDLESVELTFTCLNYIDPNLPNLASKNREGVKVTASEYVTTDDLTWAIDENEGTEVVFDCSTTENHWIQVDLGANYRIEGVTIIWEGASASMYSVTIEDAPATAHNPDNSETQPLATYTSVTQSEENGQGGGGLTVKRSFYFDKAGAQYVTINTSKAFEPGWGIKVKEIGVYGEDVVTGVENIVVDENAGTEYYNLQGQRVSKPSSGIFIRKQGNVSSKVYVK